MSPDPKKYPERLLGFGKKSGGGHKQICFFIGGWAPAPEHSISSSTRISFQLPV